MVFPGRSVTIAASPKLPIDIFPVGSVSGEWQACASCMQLVLAGGKDECVTAISDRIVQATRQPQSAIQPKVIALLSRYWACIDEQTRIKYVMDDLCSPPQRVLIEIYRGMRASNHPGGHYFERCSRDGIHVSAFIRMSNTLGVAILYFYDIFSEKRHKGRASATLRRLVNSSDYYGVTLEIPVMAYDAPGISKGLSNDELVEWYRRFGFELLDERSPKGHLIVRRMPR
jgi:hypothetical protein